MDKLTLSGLIALLSVQEQISTEGVLKGYVNTQQDGQQLRFTLIRINFMSDNEAIFCDQTGGKQKFERILQIIDEVYKSQYILTPIRIAICERTQRIMILQEKTEILSIDEAQSQYKQQLDILSQQDLQFVSKQKYSVENNNLKLVDIELMVQQSEDTPEEFVQNSITDEVPLEDNQSMLNSDMDISINAGFLW